MAKQTKRSRKKGEIPKFYQKDLYAAAHVLNLDIEKAFGLQIPFDVYLQDPMVAEEDPRFGFDENLYVKWEPGLTHGPTSARFAVVDYNGDTGRIASLAIWDKNKMKFLKGNRVLDRKNADNYQFHQVNVWAALQRALDFYEEGFGLGRPIPWGFTGNRLIVVPHAGYGKNAFYDRRSKSLQFYYYNVEDQRVFTCLSTDIINHEFGHAVLDGIRPYYLESSSVQTAAFHEFVGDLSAILIILRNNNFRRKLAEKTKGSLSKADELKFIAEQFGRTVKDRPYLRSAGNNETMAKVKNDHRPHYVSQVLTGAMYDILQKLSEHYLENRGRTPKQAFWDAIQRMQRTALQPLDLLPPVDITFKDYALAVLRTEEISNPKDPYGYYKTMLQVFGDRKILDKNEVTQRGEKPRYLFDRLKIGVFHDIDHISHSREAAYRFLDDNRGELYIPRNQDVIVADLYDANKFTRQARQLPRQIVLEYVWREDVKLDGPQYGKLNGQTTTMLCGGTLVFDECGNLLSWFRKPGTQVPKEKKGWQREADEGRMRLDAFLADIASQIEMGHIGLAPESKMGILGTRMPPITARKINGTVRLELSPHLSLLDEDWMNDTGGRQWETSF